MRATKSVTRRLPATRSDADPALEVFRLLCADIATPYAAKANRLLRSESWAALAALDIDPSAYRNSAVFAGDYLIYSFLRKYRGFRVDVESLKQKAVSTFESVEHQCRETNQRLKFSVQSDVEGILSDARRKIRRLLGDFAFHKVIDGCEWGPGATVTLRRSDAALDKKILEPRLAVTSSALRYAKAYLSVDFHWMQARLGPTYVDGPVCPVDSEFLVVDHARFTTVEKTVKQRRAINIEPTMNLFLQKGVGKFIRRRLQRVGINLDDQSRNQFLAGAARAGGLATIDLQAASDSISHGLVQLLLDPEWYSYLNDIRSKFVKMPDCAIVPLQKFSAMGNGFTFELESLIFWALTQSVSDRVLGTEGVVSVYGDDIIVDRRIVGMLYRTLEVCGFTVNKEKSFTDGHFFESCGKHYFDGAEVTPAYQKETLSDVPSLYRCANRLVRCALRMGGGEYLDVRLQRAIHYLWSICGPDAHVRYRGPIWLEGDGFLIDPYYRPKADRHGIFEVIEFVAVPVKRRLRCGSPLLATALRRGVVVDSPFSGQLPVFGSEKYLRNQRRVCLRLDDAPVWASGLPPR